MTLIKEFHWDSVDIDMTHHLSSPRHLYMREGALPDGTVVSSGNTSRFALTGLLLTALAVVYLGIFPDQILELASLSILALL